MAQTIRFEKRFAIIFVKLLISSHKLIKEMFAKEVKGRFTQTGLCKDQANDRLKTG